MDIRSVLENAQRSVSSTYDSSVENLLDRLGLEQKRSTMEVVMPAIAIFGAGLAVGAALGVMFAPKRGEELRSDIAHRAGDIRERSKERYHKLRAKGQELIEAEEMAPLSSNGARERETST